VLTAITREVSRTLDSCELTWFARQKIDIELAARQHTEYEQALVSMGARVISLPEQPEMPDALFVEDPLIVFGELAVVTRMGAPIRRLESESLATAIAAFRPLHRITAPATIEGGDVMRIGHDVFVGLSTRTSADGIRQLSEIVEPLGYRVRTVEVRGCLHLKSACCPIGEDAILVNREWLDLASFCNYRLIAVPEDEPGAANVLRIGDTVLMSSAFPGTRDIILKEGLKVRTVDISELMKAEAAITCSSVIFDTVPPAYR
jgi:dimethylargininase